MRKFLLCLWLIFVFISTLAVCSMAAEEVLTVEEEIVTGSRLYTDLGELPAPAYVIDRETIERSGASRLSDLLSDVPGIFTRSRSGNAQDEFIEIRGLTTELLILVDGVPYYKASHLAGAAAVDFRSLPLENIERIEVVKGAGSAIYGSMAAAGIVNIITRKPEEGEITLSFEGGTYDWKRGYFRASAAEDGFNASVWYSHREEGESPLLFYSGSSGDFEDKNLDYESDSGGFTLSNGPWNMSYVVGQYSSEWTYGGYYQEQENDHSRFTLGWTEGPDRFILYRDQQDKELLQDSAYGISETQVEDTAWGAEYSHLSFWKEAVIAWGISYRNEEMSYAIPDWFISYDGSRTNYAPFAEISFPFQELIVDLGLRYEIWDQDDSDDFDELIPKLCFSYQTSEGILWYLSAGRFFAMPSLYELSYFDNWFATEPNLSLRPEKGWSYELGLKDNDQHGSWNVGFFYLEMDDKIDIAPDWSQYINIAEFRSWGMEAFREWKLNSYWSLNFGLAWINAEEKADPSSSWTEEGTPEWDLDLAIDYEKGPLSGGIRFNYLVDRKDERAGIGQLSQEDVFTVDGLVRWETEVGTITLSGYNIFDEEYYLQDYANFGTTTRYYGPEARYYISWNYRF
ncbi:MAG TPA: TonB-dependent receptor [Synergistales bacterium]|nr:TonB-dependent receptor [Synergistales bacterium]